jgi:hypothetical protein
MKYMGILSSLGYGISSVEPSGCAAVVLFLVFLLCETVTRRFMSKWIAELE